MGGLIAGQYVHTDWGLSFMIPGAIMGISGFIIFLFLVPNPTDVGCAPPGSYVYRRLDGANSSDEGSINDDVEPHHSEEDRVSF